MQAKIKAVENDYLDPANVSARMAALHAQGYESLAMVLAQALFQAAHGKGAERHAQGAPFDAQPMQMLIDLYGGGFALGQAAKKMQESQRLPHQRAVAELLGAINYIAGAIIAMERHHADMPEPVAANDNEHAGWMAWAGGECPVERLTVVDYQLRGTDGYGTAPACRLLWSVTGGGGDIVAYRIRAAQIDHG